MPGAAGPRGAGERPGRCYGGERDDDLMRSPADPAEVAAVLGQGRRPGPVQVAAQQRQVAEVGQVDAEQHVIVTQPHRVGNAAGPAELTELPVPVAGSCGGVREVRGGQVPAGRAEDDAAGADAGQEREPAGERSPVQRGARGRGRGADLAQEPGERMRPVPQVDRAEDQRLDGAAERAGHQDQPARVSGHRQIGEIDAPSARRMVFSEGHYGQVTTSLARRTATSPHGCDGPSRRPTNARAFRT